ncbi:hypothetical protein D1AOALGA4SA_1252 [Olavius algarvensis Delta 1 endosymbiont]|nr:hypothetical protein D1AOALGA4SA_1252 [Olavius algarvensis Delta 1 endosymbiont]
MAEDFSSIYELRRGTQVAEDRGKKSEGRCQKADDRPVTDD